MTHLGKRLETAGPFDPDEMDYAEAVAAADAMRVEFGLRPNGGNLLTLPSGNDKLGRGDRFNTALSLAQATTSGEENVCPYSTVGCRVACVAQNGNGAYDKVKQGRRWRTLFLADNPQAFVTLWAGQLRRLVDKHGQIGHRPNAFSDIRWENIVPALFDIDGIDFYDYTKWPAHLRYPTDNYRLSFSYSGERPRRTYRGDQNIAVVFDTKKGQPLPAEWRGRPVVDGDLTDDRYDDPVGVVVGLRAKGRARKDTTGFVVSTTNA